MEPCYPDSRIGRQLREIITCFGTDPFTYRQVRNLVLGPATLKTMEDNSWVKFTRMVKVDRRWCRERRVVPGMIRWADRLEEKPQRKKREQATPAGDGVTAGASAGEVGRE